MNCVRSKDAHKQLARTSLSPGKLGICVERGKNVKNVKPVASVGKLNKHATGAQRGKTRVSQVMIGFRFASDWLRFKHVCFDWLKHGASLTQKQRTRTAISKPDRKSAYLFCSFFNPIERFSASHAISLRTSSI